MFALIYIIFSWTRGYFYIELLNLSLFEGVGVNIFTLFFEGLTTLSAETMGECYFFLIVLYSNIFFFSLPISLFTELGILC